MKIAKKRAYSRVHGLINTHASFYQGRLVGDHAVLFGVEGESIEIKHHAVNRGIFANGALRCVQ